MTIDIEALTKYDLELFCFRGAWNCVKYLVSERSDEINQCYDENFPLHQATLHDIKFLGSLSRITIYFLRPIFPHF